MSVTNSEAAGGGEAKPLTPAEQAIGRAVAEGVLDFAALSRARTAERMARLRREPAGAISLSEALAELRADER